MCTIWAFGGMENKHDIYRAEDCMRKFRESLRGHVMKIINFENNKMIPLTEEPKEII